MDPSTSKRYDFTNILTNNVLTLETDSNIAAPYNITINSNVANTSVKVMPQTNTIVNISNTNLGSQKSLGPILLIDNNNNPNVLLNISNSSITNFSNTAVKFTSSVASNINLSNATLFSNSSTDVASTLYFDTTGTFNISNSTITNTNAGRGIYSSTTSANVTLNSTNVSTVRGTSLHFDSNVNNNGNFTIVSSNLLATTSRVVYLNSASNITIRNSNITAYSTGASNATYLALDLANINNSINIDSTTVSANLTSILLSTSSAGINISNSVISSSNVTVPIVKINDSSSNITLQNNVNMNNNVVKYGFYATNYTGTLNINNVNLSNVIIPVYWKNLANLYNNVSTQPFISTRNYAAVDWDSNINVTYTRLNNGTISNISSIVQYVAFGKTVSNSGTTSVYANLIVESAPSGTNITPSTYDANKFTSGLLGGVYNVYNNSWNKSVGYTESQLSGNNNILKIDIRQRDDTNSPQYWVGNVSLSFDLTTPNSFFDTTHPIFAKTSNTNAITYNIVETRARPTLNIGETSGNGNVSIELVEFYDPATGNVKVVQIMVHLIYI